MIDRKNIRETNDRRKSRVRYKLRANGVRPRLVINKTNRFMIAQVIDDSKGVTLAYAATSEKEFPIKSFSRKNKASASELGKIIAERAKQKGVIEVMLDRSGYIYHGNIAAFADSAREGGLVF
ncbi:MAG: 50S ribosomal protein L18 [Leptospiraceae bacterium]|nr:50S ribosomal protein L18 [Leptospiraceae bacterium]